MPDTVRVVFSVNFASLEKDMWQLNGGTANRLEREAQEGEVFIFLQGKVDVLFNEFFSKYFGAEALKLFKTVTALDIFTKFVNKESHASLGHIFYMQIFEILNVCRHIGIVLTDKESDKLDTSLRILVGKKAIVY